MQTQELFIVLLAVFGVMLSLALNLKVFEEYACYKFNKLICEQKYFIKPLRICFDAYVVVYLTNNYAW